MNSHRPLTAKQYRTALDAVLPELSVQQHEILEFLMSAPHHTTSAGEIARQMGVHHLTVNALFANIGRRVLTEIAATSPQPISTEFVRLWQVLARQGSPGIVKGFPWELRPEVVESLMGTNLLEGDNLPADEGFDPAPLTEGTQSQGQNTIRSRNAKARAECLAALGSACVICGIDMGEIYGPEFQGCIHIHHLKPLSETAGPRQVNPTTDLVPVCPNCHSVIHANNQLRTPESVKMMWLKNKN
jgi:predicted HNH restriction endonuclease